MALKTKINKWLSKGIITQEQEEAILNYEKSAKSSLSWSLYGFLILAAFSVGLGVVSLIAANWQFIPDYIKLTGYFLFLSCVGLPILNTKIIKKSPLLFEVFLIFFMLLCLGGIGLISQIYNVKGEVHSALFLWSVITSGVMAVSRGKAVMHIWLIGLYAGFISWGMHNKDLDFQVVALSCFLVSVLFSMLFHNQKIVKIFPTLLSKRKAFEEWAVFYGFLSLIVFNLLSVLGETEVSLLEISFIGSLEILTFLAIAFSNYKTTQKYLLALILSVVFLFFLVPSQYTENRLILVNTIFSVMIFSLSAFFFITLEKRRLFVLCIVATIIRLIFFYIEIFTSLTVTGLMLVLLGLIIVFLIRLLDKNKEDIKKWIASLE